MITQRHRGHGGALAAARAEYYFSALSAPLRETFGCRMGLFHAEARRARRIYIIPLWPLCLCVRFFCRGREGMITQRHRGHGGALAAARAEYYFSALSAPLRETPAAGWHLRGSVGSVRDFFMGAHAEAQRARRIYIISSCPLWASCEVFMGRGVKKVRGAGQRGPLWVEGQGYALPSVSNSHYFTSTLLTVPP